MKELTRIATIQITGILKGAEINDRVRTKEENAEFLEKFIKTSLEGIDDVVVTVQDFELDLEEGADHGEEQ